MPDRSSGTSCVCYELSEKVSTNFLDAHTARRSVLSRDQGFRSAPPLATGGRPAGAMRTLLSDYAELFGTGGLVCDWRRRRLAAKRCGRLPVHQTPNDQTPSHQTTGRAVTVAKSRTVHAFCQTPPGPLTGLPVVRKGGRTAVWGAGPLQGRRKAVILSGTLPIRPTAGNSRARDSGWVACPEETAVDSVRPRTQAESGVFFGLHHSRMTAQPHVG